MKVILFLIFFFLVLSSCSKKQDDPKPLETISVTYTVEIPNGCDSCNGEAVIIINQEITNVFSSSYFGEIDKQFSSKTTLFSKNGFVFEYKIYGDVLIILTIKDNSTTIVKIYTFTKNNPNNIIVF